MSIVDINDIIDAEVKRIQNHNQEAVKGMLKIKSELNRAIIKSKGKFIGEKIRNIRHDKGIRLIDIARQLNISSIALCDYETGTRNLNMDIIYRIAKVLGVDVKELLGEGLNERDI